MKSIFRSRRAVGILAGLVAVTMIAGACDGDDADSEGEATGTATSAATSATADATSMAAETATGTVEATPTGTEMAAAVTIEVSDEGDLAPFLTDGEGVTLYMFANDEPGVSNCGAGCQANWPPFTGEATAGEGVGGVIATLESGQVTYNDQPLYYFAGDAAPGETNGQDVGNVWFVVAP